MIKRAVISGLLLVAVACGPSILVRGTILEKKHEPSRTERFLMLCGGKVPCSIQQEHDEKWLLVVRDCQETCHLLEVEVEKHAWDRARIGTGWQEAAG